MPFKAPCVRTGMQLKIALKLFLNFLFTKII